MTGKESQKDEEEEESAKEVSVKTLQKVKLHMQKKDEDQEIDRMAYEESFLNRGIPFRVNKMMWFD